MSKPDKKINTELGTPSCHTERG